MCVLLNPPFSSALVNLQQLYQAEKLSAPGYTHTVGFTVWIFSFKVNGAPYQIFFGVQLKCVGEKVQ